MKFLTIDPGISGTGLALFSKEHGLLSWKNIYPKGKNWLEKSTWICAEISSMLITRNPKVFIEWPTGNFTSNAGIAAKNTDAILKLSYLIGRISEVCFQHTLWTPQLIKVQTWKGQLPKKIVKKRAEKYFKQTGFKSHAADAVGIGQYVLENNLV